MARPLLGMPVRIHATSGLWVATLDFPVEDVVGQVGRIARVYPLAPFIRLKTEVGLSIEWRDLRPIDEEDIQTWILATIFEDFS